MPHNDVVTVNPRDGEPCDICHAVRLEPWLEVSLSGVYSRWVHRCTACGFRQVRPRLHPSDLTALYPADYFDSRGGLGYGDYAREAQRRRREAYFLARHCRPTGRQGRVLEVGCALGFLLAALREHGFEVTGVDASPFAVFYATSRFSLPVIRGTLDTAGLPHDAFDLVVQKDLLEHVIDPRAHLQETLRVLRPGGQLWLITPNGEANLRPLRTVAGHRSDSTPPQLPVLDQGHLSFFSYAHLQRLFRESGFVVERARAIGVRRGLRALGWLPGQTRFARLGTIRASSDPASADQECPSPVAAGQTPDATFAAQAVRVDQEVASYRRPWREWVPYYYVHRLTKRLDSVSASAEVGYDFEFWLRKPTAAG